MEQPHDIAEISSRYAPDSAFAWMRLAIAVLISTVRQSVPVAATYDDAVREGTIIAGGPATVRAEIERQSADLGINYLVTYMLFGTIPLPAALRSLQLFRTEVMPKLSR
jgi:alkanesulfonate monooxygenase SsuD/methylene tetrahydromethanopterin reductase-like flavin-dependent oxidoreductase (luciferase family)